MYIKLAAPKFIRPTPEKIAAYGLEIYRRKSSPYTLDGLKRMSAKYGTPVAEMAIPHGDACKYAIIGKIRR